MSRIRSHLNGAPPRNPEAERFLRKADQEWDLAGLARQDGDVADEQRHTEKAREFTRMAHEANT